MKLGDFLGKNIEVQVTPQGVTLVVSSPGGDDAICDVRLPFVDSPFQPVREELPERLREMRRLYEYGRSTEENFYRQAVFMEDYEDDFPWEGAFNRYFPTYRDLTARQLRGYFSWRTQLRRGNYLPIPESAAYLYIYELLNGVGGDTPEEIFQGLRAFETGYLDAGFGNARMRFLLRRWTLEYAVLEGLPPEMARQTADPDLLARDAALAVLRAPLEADDEAVFAALCVFAEKRFPASPVLAADPVRGKHLFSEAWRTASGYRRENGKLFSLCFGRRTTRRWYPLANAVRYEHTRPMERTYELDESRLYRCKNGIWYETCWGGTFDKNLFRGFLRRTEAMLRRYLNAGHPLKENPADDWAVPYIETVIAADRAAARPRVEIDLAGLDRIRRDAAGTRDSLLIDEEEEAEEAPDAPVPDGLPLDETHLQILRTLLDGGDAAALLREHRLMPSVAADAINEALYDALGDAAVLCDGGGLVLAEDYMEDLKTIVGGTADGG